MSVLGLEKRRVRVKFLSHKSLKLGQLALAIFHLGRNWVSVSSTRLTGVWINRVIHAKKIVCCHGAI